MLRDGKTIPSKNMKKQTQFKAQDRNKWEKKQSRFKTQGRDKWEKIQA